MIKLTKNNVLKTIIVIILMIITYTATSFLIIQRQASNAYYLDSDNLQQVSGDIDVAIVFGGGVSETGPLPLVQERLDTGYKLLKSGSVNKLILSGDNRSLDYNEPAVMYKYLIDTYDVDPDALQADFAGRSTYETCERANKIFDLQKTILVSESTHLPRAIYLCRHFGVEAYGAISDGQASSGRKLGQRWREILARNKAVFNVYIAGESTILGESIDVSEQAESN